MTQVQLQDFPQELLYEPPRANTTLRLEDLGCDTMAVFHVTLDGVLPFGVLGCPILQHKPSKLVILDFLCEYKTQTLSSVCVCACVCTLPIPSHTHTHTLAAESQQSRQGCAFHRSLTSGWVREGTLGTQPWLSSESLKNELNQTRQ